MRKLSGRLRAQAEGLISRRAVAYLRKWLPAAVMIGLVAGLASIAFSLAVDWATQVFLGWGAGYLPPVPAGEGTTVVTGVSRRWMIPVVTAIGGLVSGLLVCRFAPEAGGEGVDAAIGAFHYKGGRLRPRVPLLKLVASAVTIGSGGSAGREGPIALISAGCGSLVGRLFRFNDHDIRLALTVGIGAGLGSIFKAPLGGALLSAEVLYLEGFEVEALIPSFIATIIGYSVFASWRGFTPVFGDHVVPAFHDPKTLLSYAVLGVLCGLIGILYARTFYGVRRLFGNLKIADFLKPAVGGLLTGLIGTVLPQVLGMGYGWLQLAMEPGMLPLYIMIAVVFAKILATSFTVGSGGSGGMFAPGLVIGGMVAASLWTLGQEYAGSYLPSSPAPFVAVGMMALFGAIAHAPAAVIVMVTEMSGTYTILAPAMIAVGLAYILVGRNTIYESQAPSPVASPAHRYEYVSPLLRAIRVREAMVTNCPVLAPKATVEEAVRVISCLRIDVPVVDESGSLAGIVAWEDILPVLPERRSQTTVESIMSTNLVVTNPEATLEQALQLMVKRGVAVLPVVDEKTPKKLLGLVTRSSIIEAYESEARKMMREP